MLAGGSDMGRRKLVEDDELLAVARSAFVDEGLAVSTREIARRAGVSEAVIYQRYPTKTHLFFAAMIPQALNVEGLVARLPDGLSVVEQLEEIALGIMRHFREVVPILVQLVTHPGFDLEQLAEQHPHSGLCRLHQGLAQFLRSHGVHGRVSVNHVEPAALTLFAAMHSLAFFELLGVHGGRFDEAVIRAMVRSLWNGLSGPSASLEGER
jgi:AcrR family transcriptional regulator